jgi:RNA 3'-phosphate cyclase
MTEYIEIDGSFGEGGGSILRLSAGYSVLFNQPIIISNIRANRPTPGLRLQHLLGLKTIANLTNSNLSQCEVGTKKITFIPNKTKSLKSNIHINVNTAASLGLLLQPIQIACMGFYRPDPIEITIDGGGTHGKWAPSLNYLRNVTYRIFKRSGLTIKVNIDKYGFYPKGGAQTRFTIFLTEDNLKSINYTELGNIDLINGDIILTNHFKNKPNNIGNRIKKVLNSELRNSLKFETNIRYHWVNSMSPGVGLSLWALSDTNAIISTGTILGERNISSENLGKLSVREISKYIENDIPIDNYLSDQLIPLMTYIKSPSRIKVLEITNHAKTNLEIGKMFTNRKYKISKEKNCSFIEYI